MSLTPGTLLGPYEVLSFIGAGGMGDVYRGRDTRLARDVAIKVLAARLAGNPQFRERFEREARTVSRLTHPNVCTLYDVGSAADIHYLVMEYLEGRTLAALVASGPLPIDRGLDYAIQIADGLAKAHTLGVVHRDLKPANIMVTGDDFVKILDFGLAKDFSTTETDATAFMSVSDSGLVVGTVAYMAPEQTQGSRVDVRTDVFAFGVMLYELLSGQRPFDGGNVVSTIRRINDEEPRPLSTLRPEVPAAVAGVIAKALQKDPQLRFQSVAEMSAQLREAAGISRPGQRSDVRSVEPRWRRPRLHRWQSSTIAVSIGLAVIVGSFVAWGNWGRSTSPAPVDGMPTMPRDATAWARQGQSLLMRHDRTQNVDQAIEAFRTAITIDPASALAHAGIAEAYYRKDSATPDPQWKRLGAESARRAVELNPDLAVGHLAQGMGFLREGRRPEAEKALGRARDLDPRSAAVMRYLGDYFRGHDGPKAEEAYRAATELAPEDWRTHTFLGQFYFVNARYAEAATSWERARDLTPDNVLVLRNLAAVYHMVDRTDEAAESLQRALEIEPAATTYNNLATLRYFQGRYAEAAAAFEKAVELNPTYYLYWGNLGDAYRWIAGSEIKASEAFTRAIALADERLRAQGGVELRASLAGYLAKRGDSKRALEHVALIEQDTGRPAGTFFRTALVYEICGRRDLALRDLEAAVKGGYAMREVINEPELVKLRSDARYHRMLARFEK